MSKYLEAAKNRLHRVKDAFAEDVLQDIIDHLEHQPHYGFYQLCPKCDGEKFITVPHVHHGKVDVVCSICKGEGVIPRPEIKNMQP